MIFNKNLMKILTINLCTVILLIAFQQVINAQDSVVNTIYVKDGCDWCTQLETAIADNKLRDKLTILEKNISDEGDKAEFDNITTTCAIDNPGTPLLVVNNKCFLGFQLSRDELFRQAGIEIQEDSTTTSNETTNNSDTTNSTTQTSTSPTPTPFQTPSSETTSKIITNKVIAPQQDFKWFEIVLIIVAPISFLSVGYLAITRLKL